MNVSSCSMRVKISTKMGLSEEGGIQLDFLLKEGDVSWMLLRKKIFVLTCVSWTYYRFYLFPVQRFWWGWEQKNKSLVRTEKSWSVNVWSERLCIMFLLCWEVYVLMDIFRKFSESDFALVLLEEDFYWWWCIYAFEWGCRLKDYFFPFLVPVCSRVGWRLWIPNVFSCVGSV